MVQQIWGVRLCAIVQILKKELTAPGYAYDSGLRDQNAFVYVMKTAWKQHSSHVMLVNKQYCLNCYWKDLLQSGDLSSDDKKVSHLCRPANDSKKACGKKDGPHKSIGALQPAHYHLLSVMQGIKTIKTRDSANGHLRCKGTHVQAFWVTM